MFKSHISPPTGHSIKNRIKKTRTQNYIHDKRNHCHAYVMYAWVHGCILAMSALCNLWLYRYYAMPIDEYVMNPVSRGRKLRHRRFTRLTFSYVLSFDGLHTRSALAIFPPVICPRVLLLLLFNVPMAMKFTVRQVSSMCTISRVSGQCELIIPSVTCCCISRDFSLPSRYWSQPVVEAGIGKHHFHDNIHPPKFPINRYL